MKFKIRQATSADVPALETLIAASVRTLQVGDYTPRQIEGALATVFTIDTQLIDDGTYFVAFSKGGMMAGCGGWSFRKTLYGGDHRMEIAMPAMLDPERDAAKIRAIFVAPTFARQGVGTLLLEHVEQAASRAGFRRFEMSSTLTGLALYSLKGYREVRRLTVPVDEEETIQVVQMEKAG